jgi:dienelactone hydrolase
MKNSLILFAIVLTFPVFAQFQIGHTTITFNDPSRSGGFGTGGGSGRQIQTEIYYPSSSAGENVPMASGQFPVIVFGHGFAMSWDAYQNIWEHYAPNGYILAFPRTEGNLFPSPSHQDFGLDLKLVGEKMVSQSLVTGSIFYQGVLPNVAIIGHSMGGGASILASAGNQGIKTVVGLAPAETNPSAVSAASGVTVPALIFSGSQDGVTPPADHHLPIFDNLGSGCKTFVSILGGAHCYFANANFNCDFGEATSSTGISISRTEQHARTFNLLDPWLAFTLKDSCDSYQFFMDKLDDTPTQLNTNSTCALNGIPVISFNGSVLNSSVSGFAYQWYLNGQAIASANDQTHTPVSNGQYTVEVIFSSNCSEVSAPFNLQNLGGIDQISEKIAIYPNPADDKIYITNPFLEQLDYVLYSNAGVKILFGNTLEQIDISSIKSGIYFLKVKGQFFQLVKK